MQYPIIRTWLARLTGLLLMLCSAAGARAASPAPFAAPTTFSTPGAGFGLLRLVLALALVLAAVYAAAALLRRLRISGAPESAQLQLVTQVALGTRERAVLLRAGSQLLLVGVAPGNVRLLSVLPELAPTPAAAAGAAAPSLPSFRDLLRKSLGR